MKAPVRVGLYLKTFLGWQGGKEYARNLLMSLHAYLAERAPGAAEVHLLTGQSVPPAAVEEFRHLAHAVTQVSVELKRSPHIFFSELQKAGIEFAFPVHNVGLGAVRTADCIFDFQHRHLPGFFSAAENRDRDRSFAKIVKYADRIVVSSETSRHDLNEFYPGNYERVRVLQFTTFPKKEWTEGDPRTTLARYHLPERYFHISNQFWVHKNHTVVFHALKKLQQSGVEVHLVCTGSLVDYRNTSLMDELLAYLHTNGLYSRVHLMGLMPRLDQLHVMRCALAVVQPSLFEGWSTVLEDARTLGKRTITSALDVHHEQDLPSAQYFPPSDAEALAQLLAEAWESFPPGYDPTGEQAAFTRAHERALAFAERFYTIASEPASAEKRHGFERTLTTAWGQLRQPFRKG